MLTTQKKKNVIKSHQVHDADTGSTDVTIGLLSKRIEELTKHLKTHKKDNHSRRGLIGMVSRRRKLLAHLKKTEPTRYQRLIKKLGLKK